MISSQIQSILITEAAPFADVFTFNSGYHRCLSRDTQASIVHTTIHFPTHEPPTQLGRRALIMSAC